MGRFHCATGYTKNREQVGTAIDGIITAIAFDIVIATQAQYVLVDLAVDKVVDIVAGSEIGFIVECGYGCSPLLFNICG